MTYTKVWVEADTTWAHIAPTGKPDADAMCNYRPFPERWTETLPAKGDTRRVCPTCFHNWARL